MQIPAHFHSINKNQQNSEVSQHLLWIPKYIFGQFVGIREPLPSYQRG